QRSLQGSARVLEHASCAGDRNGVGRRRRRVRVWPVLSWRARIPPRPRTHPDADVSEAVGGWTSDYLLDPHARPILVHTSRSGSFGSGARYASTGDSDRGLWAVYDTPRLGLVTVRLGLCRRLVPRERSCEIACISDSRPSRSGLDRVETSARGGRIA